MIQNLILGIFFLKNLFRAYNVFMFVQRFQWTSSEFFFNFRFSSRKFQSRQKTHFTKLTSLGIANNMLPQHSQKDFWIYKFSSKHVSNVRKNICTAPFVDTQELHSGSTLSENVFIFLYISLIKCLFQRPSKVLSSWGWDGRRLNNFLKATRCLALAKCFTFFHFNWKFWKFNYLVAFQYFYL